MVMDNETIDILVAPRIQHFSESYLKFRSASKKAIKEFFMQIEALEKAHQQPVIIEFKIVFNTYSIPFLTPSRESKFIYKTFHYYLRKTKKRLKLLKIKPQLREKLSGKELKYFKKELRALHLVSRKRDTGFEYHLWTVALHATSTTYKMLLQKVRDRLFDKLWNQDG